MGFYDKEILRSITNNLSEDKESYKKFFDSALEKFGVNSPLELDTEKKKEFFNYIDNNYQAKNESVLNEIPASVFSAAARVTMQNPKTGKKTKVSTAAKNKDHPLYKKAMNWIKSHSKDKKKDEPKKADPKKQSKSDADFWKKQYGVSESAPEGWEGTVKAMKDEPGIDNPYALVHWMKNKGYKSHKAECIEILTKLKERSQNKNLSVSERAGTSKKWGHRQQTGRNQHEPIWKDDTKNVKLKKDEVMVWDKKQNKMVVIKKKEYKKFNKRYESVKETVDEVAMPLGSYLEHALNDVEHLIDVVNSEHAGDAYRNPKKSSKLLVAALKLLKKVK